MFKSRDLSSVEPGFCSTVDKSSKLFYLTVLKTTIVRPLYDDDADEW